MEKHEYQELGVLSLTPVQHELVGKFADTILNGTFKQAVESFEIIFDREPENDLEMEIFKALCEQKIIERDGTKGIRGVLDGGKQYH